MATPTCFDHQGSEHVGVSIVSVIQLLVTYKNWTGIARIALTPRRVRSNIVDVEKIREVLWVCVTYSMVQSPSCAANWFAYSQQIPRVSRNSKVHYRGDKRPPPVSILGQPNPVHIPTAHLLQIHPNIIHPLRLALPSGLFPSGFPTKTIFTHTHTHTHTHKMLSSGESVRIMWPSSGHVTHGVQDVGLLC